MLFSIQSSTLSKNMHKANVKLCNSTIYPPWGPVFKKKISQKCTPPSSEMLGLLRRCYLTDIDEKNQGYFWLGALQVTILRKVSRCLAFSRKCVGNHFYMAKWALIYVVRLTKNSWTIWGWWLGWKIFLFCKWWASHLSINPYKRWVSLEIWIALREVILKKKCLKKPKK